MKNVMKLGTTLIMALGIMLGGAGIMNVHADDTAPNYDPKEPPLDSIVTPYYDPKEPPLD